MAHRIEFWTEGGCDEGLSRHDKIEKIKDNFHVPLSQHATRYLLTEVHVSLHLFDIKSIWKVLLDFRTSKWRIEYLQLIQPSKIFG